MKLRDVPEFRFKPTIIGSMPHKDPVKACKLIGRYLKDIPAWPQLPARSSLEGMTAQFACGFPGLEDSMLRVKRSGMFERDLEKLYEAYLSENYSSYGLDPRHAAGLDCFLNMERETTPWGVKGQVTGPISWGLAVTDENGKAILYDEVLSDAAARMLAMNARWQEMQLARISKNTIVFIDEPAMASFGSAFFSLEPNRVRDLVGESASKIKGVKGIHCCGNTDWALMLSTGMDILSFDSYQYAHSLGLYPKEVAEFVKAGGAIAWGIVPNTERGVAAETVSSLKDRLEEAMAPFTGQGLVGFRDLAARSLVTPNCSLAGLSEEACETALEILVKISDLMRSRYC